MTDSDPLTNNILHIISDAPLTGQTPEKLLHRIQLIQQIPRRLRRPKRRSRSATDVTRCRGADWRFRQRRSDDGREGVDVGCECFFPVDGAGQGGGGEAGEGEGGVDGCGGEEGAGHVDDVGATAGELFDDLLDGDGVEEGSSGVVGGGPAQQVEFGVDAFAVFPDVLLNAVVGADPFAEHGGVDVGVEADGVPSEESLESVFGGEADVGDDAVVGPSEGLAYFGFRGDADCGAVVVVAV